MYIMIVGLLMVLGMTVDSARATILQTVTATVSTNTCTQTDTDFSTGFSDAIATALCPSASAFAGAGASGNVGLSSFQGTGGLLSSHAAIEAESDEDRNQNQSPFPEHAEAGFILDGGSFFLDGVGSVDFDVDVVFRVFPSGGGLNLRVIQWHTGGTLTDLGVGPPGLTLRGEDIGITLNGFTAQIPLTFVTLDLGLVPSHGFITIAYDAQFTSNIVRAEPAGWSFSDPGNLSGAGDFPVITFGDGNGGGVTPIPEPATFLLLGCGVLVLGAIRRFPWSGLGCQD